MNVNVPKTNSVVMGMKLEVFKSQLLFSIIFVFEY